MSTTTNAARSESKLPGPLRTVLVATILGIVSSAVGIVCFVTAFFAFDSLMHPSIMEWRDIEYFLSNLPLIVIYILLYAYLAIAPATTGGLTIGLIFHLVVRARRLGVWIAAAIGAMVGLIEGGVIAWIIAPLPDPQGWFPDLPRGLLWNGGIGIIQGLFVSMILYIWFKRKMR